ncbi:MAG: hypothetical protein FWD31_03140, partial [Planctomycetaceae bacterium]|nr:hypothetical protein [Planctomycetaceae bacterium]
MIGAFFMPKHLRSGTMIVVLAALLAASTHLSAQGQQGQRGGQRNQQGRPTETADVPPLEIPGSSSADGNAAQQNTPAKPDESYTMLANPDIATRMGLTDQQIVQVQSLIVERAQKLAPAPLEEWDAIRTESETKLRDVLTDEQQANWLKVIHEKKIQIIFNGQAWAEVLTWFADMLGLQLIMETPPTGTFTFADRKEYTPAEALDMFNSILHAKNYTLVRYDNLLHVINLRRTPQIPAVYLAKLQPGDLENRKAKFEFVAVTYALEGR